MWHLPAALGYWLKRYTIRWPSCTLWICSLDQLVLTHTANVDMITVRKERTLMQTQVSKAHLQVAMRDWIAVYQHAAAAVRVGPTVCTPVLTSDSELLLPTIRWPCAQCPAAEY